MGNSLPAGIFKQSGEIPSCVQTALTALDEWNPAQMKAGAGYYRDSGKFVVHLTHPSMDGPASYITLSSQELETITKFVENRQNQDDKALLKLLASGAERLEKARAYVAESAQIAEQRALKRSMAFGQS